MPSPQSETYAGLKQIDIMFFHEEEYRGIEVKYGQAVTEEGINYYSMSNQSPFFCLSGQDVTSVREAAKKAIDSFKEFEEKDWIRVN